MMLATLVACAPIILGAPAQTFEAHLDAPTIDRWFYPFNGTPGTRISASTFLNVEDDSFDNRDGQMLLAWNIDGDVPPGLGAESYEIVSLRVTVTVANDLVWTYDPTLDSHEAFLPEDDPEFVPDGDPGQPIECYGAGYRNGFSAATITESVAYSPVGPFGKSVRNVHALAFDEGVATDCSNHVDERWTPTPWSIGAIEGLAPGAAVPAGSTMTFDLDVADPDVQAYLRSAADGGRVVLVLASTTVATTMGAEFPSFVCREHPDVAFGFADAPRLDLVVTVGGDDCPADVDGDGDVAFPDLVALLAAWGPCPGCPADIDGDGQAAFPDLVALLAAWGPCP